MEASRKTTDLEPTVFVRAVGRYAVYGVIASGGMATVHYGRLIGPSGFSRAVAIKQIHPHLAATPEFVVMLLDEARLTARVRHPNVVSILDVVVEGREVFLVMDYIAGESLAGITRALVETGQRVPPKIAAAIVVDVLQGLHAAHEARDERGSPLDLVHRDVSPQNVIVGAEGIARVLDFGVAKAAGRLQTTRDGALKGKLAYMAPEQFEHKQVTRTVDVYAASILLWETLTGARLFAGKTEAEVLRQVLDNVAPSVSAMVSGLPREIDAVIARGLATAPGDRFPTARDLAVAVERCLGVASSFEVAEWIASVAAGALSDRAGVMSQIERESIPALRLASTSSRPPSKGPAEKPRGPESATHVVLTVTSPTIAMPTEARSRARSLALWATVSAVALASVVVAGGALMTRARASTPAPGSQVERSPSAPSFPPIVGALPAPSPSQVPNPSPPPSASIAASAVTPPRPAAPAAPRATARTTGESRSVKAQPVYLPPASRE